MPLGMNVREPTLDDVFLALTGHRAEAQQPTEEEPEVDPVLIGEGRE